MTCKQQPEVGNCFPFEDAVSFEIKVPLPLAKYSAIASCHCGNLRRGMYAWVSWVIAGSLRWRHNGCDSVSNHQPRHYPLNRLFGCRSKKTSKLPVTGLCAGNSPGTGEFPAQMASNAENVSIWWRHHDSGYGLLPVSRVRHTNKCWHLFDCTLMTWNTFQWNLNQNTTVFTQGHAVENVILAIAINLSIVKDSSWTNSQFADKSIHCIALLSIAY